MEGRDIEAVVAIQFASPEAAQWKAADYGSSIPADKSTWVAEHDKRVIGFLAARQILDELEILNLAVDPVFRGRGAGRMLLEEALARATEKGAKKAYLEVRASNASAIRFYGRHGFVTSGRRPHYYVEPSEDALLLDLQFRNV
jgi:[ribosomal protein S18]-alanine N-acetyltransferase